MELDIRTTQATAIDVIRFSDDLCIKINANKTTYKIVNNTGVVQSTIPAGSVDDMIAAFNAARKILG